MSRSFDSGFLTLTNDKNNLGNYGDMKESCTMKTKSIQEFNLTPSSESMKHSD